MTRSRTLAPVREESVQLCLRCLRGHAVLQAPNDMEDVKAAVLANSRRKPEGQPDCRAVIHDIDAGWHDANDFMRPAVDIQSVSNEWLFRKSRLPQLRRQIASGGARPPTRSVSSWLEASLCGLNAKRVEQLGIDRDRPHAQRSIACREVDFASCVSAADGPVCPHHRKRLIDLPELQYSCTESALPVNLSTGNSVVRYISCSGLG